MLKWKAAASALILAYINLLPYLCRLHRGVDWAAQYLPDSDGSVPGLLFLHAFASLPAIPLILALWVGKRARWALAGSFLVATVLLVHWHHDYDLASDAQAAIGLLFIPMYTNALTFLAALVCFAAQWAYGRISGNADKAVRARR